MCCPVRYKMPEMSTIESRNEGRIIHANPCLSTLLKGFVRFLPSYPKIEFVVLKS